ncbi:hypothetical protein Halru_0351 [Halovivax ruber XH-70]|uniref:Domain of unknown function domain-containing protein n=1 Tax=Halovivax ruber (strain DSM 18193 / JCM 13892 / XH-70) TaxID=797302 RepID=L0I638_HALRX|nr:hypothetical protein [Halovivax ruber]AGB14995.1 hypothetical protein Halru_0351 [Halovivax ruber XH-70]
MSGETRDRGILSPADRAYLRGETTLASEQSERNTRARIRGRITESLRDFELLIEHLSERDRRLLFEGDDGIETFDALVSAFAFLYEGVDETGLSFERVLSEGINLAEAKRDRAAVVDLDVALQTLTVEQLREKLRRGDALSLPELAVAQASEEITPDELTRYAASQSEEPATIDDGRIQSKVTDF